MIIKHILNSKISLYDEKYSESAELPYIII